MSALENRPNTALVVIDVQNDVVVNAFDRERIINNISSLVDRARRENTPVVWVQHNDDELPRDTDGWRFVKELVPADGEPLIHKSYRDAFEATEFETELDRLSIGRLIVTGAQTDFCVRSTAHGGLARGYDVDLVADAHTTDDLSEYGMPTPDKLVAHMNMYWDTQTAANCSGTVVATSDVEF